MFQPIYRQRIALLIKAFLHFFQSDAIKKVYPHNQSISFTIPPDYPFFDSGVNGTSPKVCQVAHERLTFPLPPQVGHFFVLLPDFGTLRFTVIRIVCFAVVITAHDLYGISCIGILTAFAGILRNFVRI